MSNVCSFLVKDNGTKKDNGTVLEEFVVGYRSWPDYLRSMEKDGTWGDHLILVAAANHYQTRICVIDSLDRETILNPVSGSVVNANQLVLGYIFEEHYVSLLPRQGIFQILTNYFLITYFLIMQRLTICI